MKSQIHNQGDLKELSVTIEKEVVEAVELMAKNSGMTVDDIVLVALKRYRSAHGEMLGNAPQID